MIRSLVEARARGVYVPNNGVRRIVNDMAHPWVIGYRRQLFWVDLFQNLDIDLERLAQG
jgi:hypothetical protein